jgi:putative hydrolase of the HAD superfamily
MTFAPPPDRVPRGLLIDYGGVLTTSVFEAFRAFERREGLERDAVARLFRADPRARELLAGLEVGSAGEAQFASGLAALLGVSAEGLIGRLLKVRPEETMIRAVRAVRRSGVRTGLISNSWGLDGYPLERLGELFDAVIVSGQVGLRKPDPEIYRLGAREIGVEPADCVFVDDLPGNLAPAVALGMIGVHHADPARTTAELGRLFRLDLDPAALADADTDTDVAADADPDRAQVR